jgi:hypothetical protein
MVCQAPNRGKAQKASLEKAKIQANRTASAKAYAQPTQFIKIPEISPKIKQNEFLPVMRAKG